MNNSTYDFAFIAGSGALAYEIIINARNNDINLYVIALNGISDANVIELANDVFGIGEIGKIIKIIKNNEIKKLAIAGYVKRPDFSKIAFDATGLKILPKILLSAKKGDDAIMRTVLGEFENNNIEIVGPEVILQNLLAPIGVLGEIIPNDNDLEDIKKAAKIVHTTGRFDIGQAIVICDGNILAIEAQEGTDAMLSRINSLPPHLIGSDNERRGILLKAAKPIQDKRIDLPVIGLETFKNAKNANLKGIAIEAGAGLISQKIELINAANENNMFIYGFDSKDIDDE